MSAYGNKLNPYRKLRESWGVKGIRQNVIIINNPSTIDQNQQLLVRFPNLSNNDVIVPHSARLAFDIELVSSDNNATVYQNLGRAIIKKIVIRISGNEVMSIDDSDIYHCYIDLWKPLTERLNMVYQGIGKPNMLKHSWCSKCLDLRWRPSHLHSTRFWTARNSHAFLSGRSWWQTRIWANS